jgi:uncharacterized RDD family membrane protein YckC
MNESLLSTTPSTLHFASLKHRLISMVYEAILLVGIFFGAGFLFDVLTQSHGEYALRYWRQFYLFMVTGSYFTWFWRHGGQTLAMQTWHIKLVSTTNLQSPTRKQAWLRYWLSWMWFLPALGFNYLFEVKQWPSLVILFLGWITWACTSTLDKNGQFLHDKLAGTQLISISAKKK